MGILYPTAAAKLCKDGWPGVVKPTTLLRRSHDGVALCALGLHPACINCPNSCTRPTNLRGATVDSAGVMRRSETSAVHLRRSCQRCTGCAREHLAPPITAAHRSLASREGGLGHDHRPQPLGWCPCSTATAVALGGPRCRWRALVSSPRLVSKHSGLHARGGALYGLPRGVCVGSTQHRLKQTARPPPDGRPTRPGPSSL